MTLGRRWAIMAGLALWSCYACGRQEGGRDYADKLATEVERRTIPPGASRVSLVRSEMKPCVIRAQWTFATLWDRARYGEWLKTKLLPEFSEVEDLTFSRHVNGDAHSVVIETLPEQDSLHVQVTLCAYPD
jgi:hypothetical protein